MVEDILRGASESEEVESAVCSGLPQHQHVADEESVLV